MIGYIGFTVGAEWPVIILRDYSGSRVSTAILFRHVQFVSSLPFVSSWGPKHRTSHTFLSIWLVVANLFCLWTLAVMEVKELCRSLAQSGHGVAAFIFAGGAIDLFAIRNSSYVEMNYERDDLVRWLRKNTKPE